MSNDDSVTPELHRTLRANAFSPQDRAALVVELEAAERRHADVCEVAGNETLSPAAQHRAAQEGATLATRVNEIREALWPSDPETAAAEGYVAFRELPKVRGNWIQGTDSYAIDGNSYEALRAFGIEFEMATPRVQRARRTVPTKGTGPVPEDAEEPNLAEAPPDPL